MDQSTTSGSLLEPQNSLVRLGGSLGVAGSTIGLLIMLGACFGFDASFRGFPLLPLIFGLVGLPLSILGAVTRRQAKMEDTRVLFALFVNAISLLGAVVEIAVWQHWATFSFAK